MTHKAGLLVNSTPTKEEDECVESIVKPGAEYKEFKRKLECSANPEMLARLVIK